MITELRSGNILEPYIPYCDVSLQPYNSRLDASYPQNFFFLLNVGIKKTLNKLKQYNIMFCFGYGEKERERERELVGDLEAGYLKTF